ncbi:MAG: STM3941 family protein [Flammeovirgaceae bacterium]
MNQERIEIKLSKTKGILTFLGSVAFVLVSLWLISFADDQDRYTPTFVKGAGYVGLIFFGLCGLYIFYKLFDTKPGLIIDNNGILDNSSAASGHIIKWERIVGLRVGQVKSTKFILIDLVDPEQFMNEMKGIKKTLMWGTYKMYGTLTSISSSTLNCDFDELYNLIDKRLQSKSSV